MTAAANKQLMQDLLAKAAAGDRRPYFEAVADDVTMVITGQYSWSQTFGGKEALLRDLYGYLASVLADGRRVIPLRFIADHDHVVVQAKGEMRTKAGQPYNNDYCLVYRLCEGRIVEIREYCDSALTEAVLGPFPPSLRRADVQAIAAERTAPMNAGEDAERGNRRIIQQIFDELAKSNPQPLLEHLSDDFRFVIMGSSSWSRSYDGKKAVQAELFTPLRKRLGRITTIPLRLIAEGDLVVVEARGQNTTSDGRPYNNSYCNVLRVEHGRITEWIEYCDTQLINFVLGPPSAD
jgi:ketosteroid isomerase-like protein